MPDARRPILLGCILLAACGERSSPLDPVAEQLALPLPSLTWASVSVGPPPRPGGTGGAALFLRYCAACHGSAGDGHGDISMFLRVPPADLTRGELKLKSTAADERPLADDVFRTVSAGIPASGMPSFVKLAAADRWAIVEHVQSLSPRWQEPAGRPLDLERDPVAAKLDGAEVYRRAGCASCHGDSGGGDGPSAHEIVPAPTRFLEGPAAFKGGASARDVFRTLLTGMGTMPSYAVSGLSRAELWAISDYVAGLAARGRGDRVRAWRAFLGTLGFSGAAPAAPAGAKAPLPGADGCLRCHADVDVINAKMQPVLLAFSAGRPGVTCVLCHEGDADGATQREAHAGLIRNPGSLWVVGLGMGCAKCHSTAGALTTFQGRPLPEAVGGRLMSVVSRVSDPTGETGSNHAYRVPRGLMAAELGKATTTFRANGLAGTGTLGFADVAVDDPDGPVPTAGSAAYRTWVGRAIDHKFLQRLEGAEVIPAYAEGLRRFGRPEEAAVGEMFREDCARCHLWDRGFPGAGGRYRSEGCSACHVLYPVGDAAAAPRAIRGSTGEDHPIAHRITAQIPSSQCAHCHWRGGSYYADIHYARGLDCVDCHGSIDVHGDGNVYPTMHLQVEVACEDCHGTTRAFPWELPVGYGTPVPLAGARGVVTAGGVDHLLTSRGNARASWIRRGDAAAVVGLDGREHAIPLLKTLHENGHWASEAGRVAMDALPGHLEKLECLACHVKKVVQCQGCHTSVDMQGTGVDWTGSVGARPSPWDRAAHRPGPGHAEFSPSPRALVEPTLGVDLAGRVTSLVPGCLLTVDVTDPSGRRSRLTARGLTPAGLPRATLAPLIPHAVTRAARSCESCHSNPAALGYGIAQDRGSPPDAPPTPERRTEISRSATSRWDDSSMDHGLQAGGGPTVSSLFDVNRLVTRGGRQLESLADPGEHPLAPAQRDATERQGTCLACHRNAGTPLWEKIRQELGPAPTPEAHDRAVERILEGFAKPAR